MSEFQLPSLELSDSATVARWLKQPGEPVAAQEKLLEVFSERFDWDILSPTAGVLKEIVAAEGAEVKPGAALAVIDRAAPGSVSPVPAPPRAARVTPLAARIAADRQVDLERARGSGPDGRVSKQDVLALLQPGREQAAEPKILQDVQTSSVPVETLHARPRSATTFVAVDMSHATAQRDVLQARWLQREGFPLDLLPYVVSATAAALRSQTHGHNLLASGEIARGSGLHIEVVKAGGSALLLNADVYNLVGVARRLHATQPGSDGPAQQAFIIEDHGSGGALLASGLLSSGAAAMLSVGTVKEHAVAVGDAVQVRPMVYLGLTYDPHVVDEGQAGRFIAELKRLLELVSFS